MKAIELFSGAGGLALGVKRAGFEAEMLVERDKHAVQSLRKNFSGIPIVSGDVREVDFSDFRGEVDLVAGGPPCQPFSMGGKAQGFKDRRDMFSEAVRAVSEVRPKAFMFENVRGLMRPAFENYVEYIRLQMEYPEFPISANATWEANLQRLQRYKSSKPDSSLRYSVILHVADAADYGVPQRRHRVFFVGFRSDVRSRWFFPSPTHSSDNLLWDKWVSGLYWDRHNVPNGSRARPTKQQIRRVERLKQIGSHDSFTAPWRTVRDAIRDLPPPLSACNGSGDHRLQPGARSYPGHTGSPWDEPAKALKAGDHGVPGGENMLRHSNGKVRYFTVRESARLQSFPDDHKFQGSWTEVMRQLGNAVPVELAEQVARSVAEALQAETANV